MQQTKRRQDLKYLGDVARTSTRNMLSVDADILSESEVRAIMQEFRETIPRVLDVKDEDLPSVLVKKLDSIPISGIISPDGLPLHPPTINNSQGKLSVRRNMGGAPAPPLGLKSIVEVCGRMVLEREHVYTNGTWKGFCVRLEKQMGRKTKSIHKAYHDLLGFKADDKFLIKQLNKLMPRKRSNPRWPKLDEDLHKHLEQLQITANSSAGAPYWRNKGECLSDVLSVGIPVVLKAIKERKLNKLWKENPEFFVCEVKNKLDRYKSEELDQKTRPYCAIPAHWALLFSVLTQRFQETLELFDKTNSCNAYGFSSSRGGLKRFYQWMKTADKRGKVACYGDDTCLVIRKNGKVYRVDPDFQQMDGSLDRDDMRLVTKWVLSCLEQEEGHLPEVWKVIGEQWAEMASNPIFVVDGQAVYQKERPNGLLSGVPGTTLFDTVKSVLSWELYLDNCQQRGLDVLDENNAVSFMKSCGLVIKPGTWAPVEVPEARPGVKITDHKFLGVQILVEEYEGDLVFLPTVPEKEALEMLVVQKDDPFKKETSGMTASRRLFDRMRGLYITVGFTNPLIEAAIHNTVNQIDPVAVLMTTAVVGGEKPDTILLEDFAYPDSSGFPSREFCLSLYSDTAEMAGWTAIYPELGSLLAAFRQESRAINQKLVGDKVKVLKVEEAEEIIVPPIQFGDVLDIPPGKSEKVDISHITPAARSHISSPDGKISRKTTPTLGEALVKHLESVGVTQCGSVCEKFLIKQDLLERTCKNYGIFITGSEPGDLVCLYPIQAPYEDEQQAVVQVAKAEWMKVDKGTSYRAATLSKAGNARPAVFVATAPEVLVLDFDFVEDIGRPPLAESTQDAIRTFNIHVTKNKNITGFRWRTTQTFLGENPVELSMEILVGETWLAVGKCRSINKKMCQRYLVGAVYEFHRVELKKDKFSTGIIPPPPDYSSWADQVTYAEEVEPVEALWENPLVCAPQAPPSIRSDKEIALLFVQEPREVEAIERLVALYRQNQYNEDFIISTLTNTHRKYLDLHLPKQSARSKRTPEQRHKLNRREAERKKRRLATLRGA